MRRREFMALMAGAAMVAPPRRAWAQERVHRIALISAAPPTPAMLNAFREAMRERGYTEGRNASYEVRSPRGTFADDPAVLAGLAGHFDLAVVWSTPAVEAVRRAVPAMPIVMVSVGDPVRSGFVSSLARPGGNITGVSNVTNDLSAKVVEIFFEFIPGMKRVCVVSNSYNPNVAEQLRETEAALKKLNAITQVVEARAAGEYERVFADLARQPADGMILLSDPSVVEHSRRIGELARIAKVPTAFQRRESVIDGGLFSYGGSIVNQYRLAAAYVDRILKGDKPSELPVEQPTKFELVINLQTAKLLGIQVPPTLLARADEVVE